MRWENLYGISKFFRRIMYGISKFFSEICMESQNLMQNGV